jgi:hypothetical protein
VIEYPPYRPSDVSLRLPSQPVIPNFWRSTEAPEITGSIPEGAELRLTYRNIPDSEALELLLSWRATAGGAFPFPTLPAQVAAGVENAAMARRITTPTPLVWALAEPPRQSWAKAGRSTVEVFLKTELRFRLVLSGPPEPEAPALPDMWLSRLETETENSSELSSAAAIANDGGTYHVAVVRLADDSTKRHQYVIRRDADGVILWQKRLADAFTMNNFLDTLFYGVAVTNDNAFVISHRRGTPLNRAYAANLLSQRDLVMQCINENGTVRWQKQYWLNELNGSTFDGSLILWTYGVYQSPYENAIIVLARPGNNNNNGGFNGFLLLRINPSNGAVISSQAIQASGLGGSLEHAYLYFRNGRIYLVGSWTVAISTMNGFALELSAQIDILFTSYYHVNGAFYYLCPSADGGWYALGYDTNTGYLSRQSCVYKLDNSFGVVWKQKRFGSSADFYLSGKNNGNVRQIPFAQDGNPVYFAKDLSVANLSGAGRVNVSQFDYNIELGTNWAFAGGSSFGGGSHSVDCNDPTFAYDATTKMAIGWYSHYRSGPVGRKLVIYGIKGPLSDQGERFLDVGLGSSIASRSDLVPGRLARSEYDLTPNILPVRNDGSNLNWGPVTHTLLSLDTAFPWEDGNLVFLHYLYRDPEYTAPTDAGSAGLVLYTGNSAVQKLSTGALFTPEVIFHANRSAATNKIIFGNGVTLEHFERWNTTTTGGITVNGVVGSGEGFFTISGRTIEWNLLNDNYAALAFAAVSGALAIDTYTGNGGAWQTVNHSLGVAPDLVIVNPNQALGAASSALLADGLSMSLGSNAAASAQNRIRSITSNSLEIGGNSTFFEPALNLSARPGTIYSFKSGPDWDVGLFTGNGTTAYEQNLGYQPKAILLKVAIGGTSDWLLCYRPDGSIGTVTASSMNSTAAEASLATVSITATGFSIAVGGPGNTGSTSALYLAIR